MAFSREVGSVSEMMGEGMARTAETEEVKLKDAGEARWDFRQRDMRL